MKHESEILKWKTAIFMAANLHFKDKITKLYSHSLRKSGRCRCMFLYHLQHIFLVFFLQFSDIIRYIESLKTVVQKAQFSHKKDVLIHNFQLIYNRLWLYISGFGCNNSSKITTFRPKMRIMWHNAYSLQLSNTENGLPWQCPSICEISP